MLICRGLYTNLPNFDAERFGNILFHDLYMRKQLGGLRDDGSIYIHNLSLPRVCKSRCLSQKHPARRSFPTWIRIGKKMANISLTQSAKERIADRVHEHVGI